MFFPFKEALDSPSRESDKHANAMVFYQILILRVQCSFAWYWNFLVRYQSFISSYLSFVGTEFALFVVCVALLMLRRIWGWGWKEIWVKEKGEAWERKRRERKGRTGKEKEDSEKGEKGEGTYFSWSKGQKKSHKRKFSLIIRWHHLALGTSQTISSRVLSNRIIFYFNALHILSADV